MPITADARLALTEFLLGCEDVVACAQYGLACEVWQVRASYDQKPYRRMMIETFGGTVHPSP